MPASVHSDMVVRLGEATDRKSRSRWTRGVAQRSLGMGGAEGGDDVVRLDNVPGGARQWIRGMRPRLQARVTHPGKFLARPVGMLGSPDVRPEGWKLD